MKKYTFPFLTVLFLVLIFVSGYFCEEYPAYKYIIFYTVSVPAVTGFGICCFIAGLIKINDVKR